MRISTGAWSGRWDGFAIGALCWLLAACAPRYEGPAAVMDGGAGERHPGSVTVQRGQTLSGISQTYHVPMRAIAEANHLSAPYRIEAGRTLILPGNPQLGAAPSPMSVAAMPPAKPESTPPLATVPNPMAMPSQSSVASPDRSAPTPPERPSVSAAPLSPPIALTPAPAVDAAPPATKPAPTPSMPAATAEQPPSSRGTPALPRGNGAFVWPVRGHVLAAYGSASDGTHNDGINIGAPRGAPVQAAEAGIVAYTGNELRGYGNLILLKHANGWISAYAHCDLIQVKRGERVARGQVIARVGSTGNVREPQLHFELRRGNHAVDPREFLVPLPTAATKDTRSG